MEQWVVHECGGTSAANAERCRAFAGVFADRLRRASFLRAAL
jgi:hypothetical protein